MSDRCTHAVGRIYPICLQLLFIELWSGSDEYIRTEACRLAMENLGSLSARKSLDINHDGQPARTGSQHYE